MGGTVFHHWSFRPSLSLLCHLPIPHLIRSCEICSVRGELEKLGGVKLRNVVMRAFGAMDARLWCDKGNVDETSLRGISVDIIWSQFGNLSSCVSEMVYF